MNFYNNMTDVTCLTLKGLIKIKKPSVAIYIGLYIFL